MTPKAFKAKVIELGGTIDKPKDYNTNNSWGFGGMCGTRTRFVLDGVVGFLDVGQLCYRHLAPEKEQHVHIGSPDNKPFTLDLFMRLFSEGARSHEEFVQRWKPSCNDKKSSTALTASVSNSTPIRSSRKTRGKARQPS